MARVAPFAAAASAALILWHAARDKPAAVVSAPAPLIYPGTTTVNGLSAARSSRGATAAQTAATVSTNGSGSAGTGNLGAKMDPRPATASATDAQSGVVVGVQQAGVASTIEVVVGRNDTMDAIFRRMALDKADLAAIRDLPGIRQSLDYLKPGDAIKVTHTTTGGIKELSRKVSDTQTLKVVREEAGFAAKMVNNPVDTRVRTAKATIDSSLFQAAESSDISDMVALKLANVFAWDIDFVLDIRKGDHFTVAYEQIYQNGKFLRDGEVLAAEFVNDGKVYRAVRFAQDGGSPSYYTPDGRPMRKAFLRAPVEFTRVSSVFNPARLHPILNRIRGHMGTDYAAPTGTPVHAAGDGHVSFKGTRGGYGNAVVLSHSNSVSTLYGHMSRFAKNIRVGSHVNQGDVIGYVGMTGLATGPHLHYEYLMNGVHMNPQTVHLPGAEPLRADSLSKFRAAATPLLSNLANPALAGAGAASTLTTNAPAPAQPGVAQAGGAGTAVSTPFRTGTTVATTALSATSSASRSKTAVN